MKYDNKEEQNTSTLIAILSKGKKLCWLLLKPFWITLKVALSIISFGVYSDDDTWRVFNKINHANIKVSDVLERKKLGFITRWPTWLKATIYLAPALILLGVFTFYPIFNSFLISFYTGFNIQTGEFDGFTFLGNYAVVLRHANFKQAVINTSIIVLVSVPITIFISLFIAVALNSIKPFRSFFQTIFFLPYVTNTIAIGLVFAFIFSGNERTILSPVGLGLANQIITMFGGQPIPWLASGATYWSAMSVILVYSVWNGLAFKIIVFLAGIQGIDKQYYQAAQIDGASRAKAFSRITVPLISPMIFYILITSVIGSFKTFTSVVAIINRQGVITTGRDGVINLKTIVFHIYDYIEAAALDGVMSYASAAAIILFAIILVFTILQLEVGKRRVHY